MKFHPLADYPLDGFDRRIECCVRKSDPTYITFLMLEASLYQCASFVQGTVLDVGCGFRPYENSYYKAASKYIGLDYLSDRSKPDIIAPATDIPLGQCEMDTVVSNETLEHVAEPAKALSEMFRVLRPGGYMILSCPAYWPRHEQPYDYYRYPYDGIIALVQSVGFKLEKLYCRGRTYAFLGQVLQHTGTSILRPRVVSRAINELFLKLDRRRSNDKLTLGWTVLARRENQ
jgi:SAM-dependent methyltransferase